MSGDYPLTMFGYCYSS